MERGSRLRRRVWALGPRGPGSRVPELLRSDITAYARERQAGGASLEEIAAEVGLTRETIRNWLRSAKADRELVPVAIVPEIVEGAAIVVVSPQGYRVEGLDVAGVATLLRMLD